MTFTFDARDALTYRTWLQLMLGIKPSPCAMRDADRLYAQHRHAILGVARLFASAVLPAIWRAGPPPLYRGLRLEDPQLHGQLLPPHHEYDQLPSLSFSEDRDVAAYFADSGPLGLPAPAILDLATGRVRPGLPPHGYIATASVEAEDVLFHWKYALKFPWLVDSAGPAELETLFDQREVTVRNRPDRRMLLETFTTAAADYIADRYPGGEWIPPAHAFR